MRYAPVHDGYTHRRVILEKGCVGIYYPAGVCGGARGCEGRYLSLLVAVHAIDTSF